MGSRQTSEPGPPAARLAAFSAIMVSVAGAGFPLTAYLPAFYAQYHGIAIGTVGLVFMLVRIVDTAWDPIVGHFSDRTRLSFGRRRSWIAAGLPIYIGATWAAFMPSGSPNAVYLFIVLIPLYAGWSMLQIPLYAWSGEISGRYHERTRVQTYLGVASAIGLMLVLLVPALLDQLGLRDQTAKVAAMGAFIIASAVIGGALTLRAFPDAGPTRDEQSISVERLVSIIRDPLLLRVLASDFVVTFGQFARSSLMLFFFTQYMNLGAAASLMFVLQYSFGIVAGPLWLKIGYRLGKHRALIAAELIQAAVNAALILVTSSTLWLLILLLIAQGLTQGSGNLMLRAILADIADKQRLETGSDHGGLLFSIFGLSMKAATAVAVGVVLPLVGWLGFSADGANDAGALLGLKCVFALVPAGAHILAAVMMLRFPLDEQRHRAIRSALDRRDQPIELTPHPPSTTI